MNGKEIETEDGNFEYDYCDRLRGTKEVQEKGNLNRKRKHILYYSGVKG